MALNKTVLQPIGKMLSEVPVDSTFRKLGEQVDLAAANHSRAVNYARTHDIVAELLVSLGPKTNFGDGSQQLANAIGVIITEMMPDLVSDALQLLENRAEDAKAEMAKAFAAQKQPKQKASA